MMELNVKVVLTIIYYVHCIKRDRHCYNHSLCYTFIVYTEFDLEKEKSVLDDQGVRIGENQENSQKNRRKLAESTRGISFIFFE